MNKIQEHGMNIWDRSWYRPGNWALPRWWTDDLPVRSGRTTRAQQVTFYNGQFARNVLGHTGGITNPPATTYHRF